MISSRAFIFLSLVAVSVAQPSNDRCVNAQPLVANTPVDGDTSQANFDYNAQGVCGGRSDRSAVWYSITGKGREVSVQVCTNNGKETDYGVFNVCNSQNCNGFPAVETGFIYDCAQNTTLDYTFVAMVATKYYVHVRSDIGSISAREGSQFTIQYLEDIQTMQPSAPPSALPSSVPTASPTFGDSAAGLSALFSLLLSSLLAVFLR
mmetsp:Transcript_23346/g.57447  ORF Transcript_23346/g.57447 Transcript_23346/m.57447 type:complete len:206 (-) Transcript_23346:148-765(-)